MKIQLTIKTTYLPNWNQWEGIRELVQNGRDAEFEHHAPLKVDWLNGTLRLENEGVVLPLKALLLGHTTKLGRSDTIGKFGEGLKLGILALVRSGHKVRIRNGSEVWVPSIEWSETFEEDVLTFTVEKGRQEKNRLRIEVSGVEKADWDLMRQNFLFIRKPRKGEAIDTIHGTLLTGARYRGKVFVKGIFVQNNPELQFGYNFTDADLDRDRKMIEAWNLRYNAKCILMAAVSKDKTLSAGLSEILEQVTPETEGLESYNVNEKAAKIVVGQFRAKHGPDAVPVASLAESQDVEHLGKKGIVVPKPLGTVLATVMGTVDEVKEGLRKEVVKTWSWHELTSREKKSLTESIALINAVTPMTLDEVDIADFRSDDLMGQHREGRTIVAHKYLADPDTTLQILVHEIAHKAGGDGEHKHISRVEDIWKGIVSHLRKTR